MRKFILFGLVGLVLTSCVVEGAMCPSYGDSNRATKHGQKAQARYARHARRNV